MTSELRSPDVETFYTPPTTPGIALKSSRPIVAAENGRTDRTRRPSSITTASGWNPDLVQVDHTPETRKETMTAAAAGANKISNNDTIAAAAREIHRPEFEHKLTSTKPMDSPCFVHSLLDKGASLSDWLRGREHQEINDLGVAESLRSRTSPNGNKLSVVGESSSSSYGGDDEDDGFGSSLTKKLAETAVGVREMSKQLGRTRVRSGVQTILIITKARDNRLIKLTRDLALYLMLKRRKGYDRGFVVYVDNQLRRSRRFDAEGMERDHPELFAPIPRRRSSSTNSLSSLASQPQNNEFYLIDEGQLRYWTSDMCRDSPHLFDFVVTLGGDGTVLFTSWLFQSIVPPVLPFALGSLGFLTNFDFVDYQTVMDSAIDTGIRVNLRMRFTCTVYRAVTRDLGKGRKAKKNAETGEIMMKNVEEGGWEALEGGYLMPEGGSNSRKEKEIMCLSTRPAETFEVLNELVVDRGPSPYVSLLELFGDEHHMTTVQADGLTVSTPTGSTAYSLSAGGSLVHPEIPALLITPICPHTLSFRPMLLPDSMELRICVPYNSRSTAWASFDGRGRVEIKQGDHIKVTASKYPFPTVCADNQSTDWFYSISRTLKWNERERQKSFVVVEEGYPKASKPKEKKPAKSPSKLASEQLGEDDEEDEVSDEGEEDGFDIDDSSPEAASQSSEKTESKQLQTDDIQSDERPSRDSKKLDGNGVSRKAATALHQDIATPRKVKGRSKSRSKSRCRTRPTSSDLHSGIDSPDRYATPHFVRSGRQVEFCFRGAPSPTGSSSSDYQDDARYGARDDIHSDYKASMSGKSRIPKERDAEFDNAKTPTLTDDSFSRKHPHRVHSTDHHPPRAFAVWGHDESDSNASDSDV